MTSHDFGGYDDHDYEETLAEIESDTRHYWQEQLGGDANPIESWEHAAPPLVGLLRSTVRQESHLVGQCDDDECPRCWNPPG